jgi:hypothetical protein
MAKTTRQTVLFGVEDWKRIYQTYSEGDFQSYDFETLRKSFIDYLRQYYPETFNDYIESSEFIALLDVMAFMGQALAFRTDLNTRENYIDTAERRDSVIKLANLVSYTPQRNTEANGYLKVFSVQTTENVTDYNGVDLANISVNWADPSNFDWREQFTAILNASLVDTQYVGSPGNDQTILGVDTQEYTINLVPGYLPVIPYTATINGVNMPFEAVNATSLGETYIYEPPPLPNGQFNILYRNDQLGYSSANTGYFFYFKQGTLLNQDFNLAESISNRTVNINIEGVNNTDVWLYQLDNLGNTQYIWEKVPSVYAAAVEQMTSSIRKVYSVASRTNDQITLVFGDNVFATIPVGQFRNYVRASNGLQYIINPENMQSVQIPISYVSRTGTIETITFTCGITSPVTNAAPRETIDQIKQRAPARYYTQDRMVNGEDYTNFPFTTYNSIIKSSALNRSSIGTSRYLDLVDPTGKYSSTNVFSSDGALWYINNTPAFTFTYQTTNDINNVVLNDITPILLKATFKQFYYAYFPRTNLTPLNYSWHESTTIVNETTGYFVNSSGTPVPVGSTVSNSAKFIVETALVKFVPPTGYYFDVNNELQPGIPTKDSDHLIIWASPTALVGDGINGGKGNLANGTGPVVLNTFVPTGAIATEVIPKLTSSFSTELRKAITNQIFLKANFGLGYDSTGTITGTPYTWYLITSTNLDIGAAWSQTYAANTSGANLDSSWLIQATYNGNQYTVVSRSLNYYFGSVLQTRFFFETAQAIYDSRTGTVISDFAKVLKTNSRPYSNSPLLSDITLKIIGQPVLTDGLVDDYQVLVGYQDYNNNGIPTDPDFFEEIVGVSPSSASVSVQAGNFIVGNRYTISFVGTTNFISLGAVSNAVGISFVATGVGSGTGTAVSVTSPQPYVFFQLVTDFDNLERYLLQPSDSVNSLYPTLAAIEQVKEQYPTGKIFYAYSENAFYTLTITLSGTRILTATSGWQAEVGRQDLYFQYRHNSALTNLIDPGSTNIIDLYLVTSEYYTQYVQWIQDTTGVVTEPLPPTIDQLTTEYAKLQDYKMISDNMILNSVEFLPLFGSKAPETLRAIIKVIPAANTNASSNQIRNLVLSTMNAYFDIANWNFGDTFYFSELAAYIHSQIGTYVASVVLVPLNPQKSFGDLYEIQCAPYQIFVNGATINDIEVIQSLTSTNLQTASGSGAI